jgi:Arc/MetJ-type ribon-helix-helix transcriptional regulator
VKYLRTALCLTLESSTDNEEEEEEEEEDGAGGAPSTPARGSRSAAVSSEVVAKRERVKELFSKLVNLLIN